MNLSVGFKGEDKDAFNEKIMWCPQGTLCKTIDALTPMGDFHVCLSTFKLFLLNLTQYFLLSPISLKCGSLSVPSL